MRIHRTASPIFILPFLIAVLIAASLVIWRSDPYAEPQILFPEAEPLKHRHRNHSMSESPDGQFRLYAAQKGDVTDLLMLRLQPDRTWSQPETLDLPRRETNASPRFSQDGWLYYASDAPHPERPGRDDLNIWRVPFRAGELGTPEVLPDVINSGASEGSFMPLGPNRAVFTSTRIGGVGGFDIYLAEEVGAGLWDLTPFAHNTLMADEHIVATPDGKHLFWYAHLPSNQIYGVVDLFMSSYDGAEWSAPKNLGPVINTPGIDYGPGVSGDGKLLFFSRDGVLMAVSMKTALKTKGYQANP